jgi:hypothetical protein
MIVDLKVKEAIEAAVAEAGQEPTLAPKLIRWFEAIASGSEQITDQQAAGRHLELLYEATQSPTNESAIERMLAELGDTEEPS